MTKGILRLVSRFMRAPLPLGCFVPVILLFSVATGLSQTVESERRVITFDPPQLSNPGDSFFLKEFTTQEFRFSMGADHKTFQVGSAYSAQMPFNGTSYLYFTTNGSLAITHREGLPFTPHTVDVAEKSGSQSVTFSATFLDGSQASITFTLDQVQDGTGPEADFQTFSFPQYWGQVREIVMETSSPGSSTCYLDNLDVTVHGIETPVPLLPAPLIYDIDWNGSPHVVDQPTAVGGQDAPAIVNFGQMFVRQRIGPMTDRPLEMRRDVDVYDQFTLACGYNADRYMIEFDVVHLGDGGLTLFLDATTLEFWGSGSARMSKHNSLENAFSATYQARKISRVRVDYDIAHGLVSLFIDGRELGSTELKGNLTLEDLKRIRFSVAGEDVVGLDNLQVSAYAPSSLMALSASVLASNLVAGGSEMVPVVLVNSGSEELTVTEVVQTSPFITVDASFPLTIPAGGRVTVPVTMNSLLPGGNGGYLVFLSTAGRAVLTTAVQGEAGNLPAPVFRNHPLSVLQQSGGNFSLEASFGMTASSYEWFRNDEFVTSTTTPRFSSSVHAQSLPDKTGSYRVEAVLADETRVVSESAEVSFYTLDLLPQRSARIGDEVILTIPTEGAGLSLEWTFNGETLTQDSPGVRLEENSLILESVGVLARGRYNGYVRMSGPKHGETFVRRALSTDLVVQEVPQIIPLDLPPLRAGQEVTVQLSQSYADAPATFSATGLPPGVTLNPQTGELTGRVLTPSFPYEDSLRVGPYLVEIQATNEYATGDVQMLEWWVHPVLERASYAGLIERVVGPLDVNGQGGRFKFSVTARGRISGRVYLADKSYPALGNVIFDEASGEQRASLSYGTGKSKQTLDLTLLGNHRLASANAVEAVQQAPVIGGRIADRAQAAAHAGLYPVALMPSWTFEMGGSGQDTEGFPGGIGFLRVKVAPSGTVSWAGLRGNGSRITGSQPSVGDWTVPGGLLVPFFDLPRRHHSSLLGWISLMDENADGYITWGNEYVGTPAGVIQNFPLHDLTVVGSRHTPPERGTVLAGLETPQEILLQGPLLDSRLFSPVEVQPNHRVVIGGEAEPGISLNFKIQPKTSSFTGRYKDRRVRGDYLISRFQGVFVSRLGVGVGTLMDNEGLGSVRVQPLVEE
jgi:hypothetical protein